MQGKQAEANGTDRPGAALLLAHLTDVKGRHGHWVARCPLPDHPDTKPSLTVEYRRSRYEGEGWKLLVACTCTPRPLPLLCEMFGLGIGRVLSGNEVYRQARPKFVEPIDEEKVRRYVSALHKSPARMGYLTDTRGLTVETITTYKIGYDEARDRYTLPVYDGDGALVNVRHYKPGAATGQKMKNSAGHGTPARLYPDLPPGGAVVVCEGEWDALVLRQHGLPAVTGTHGAAKFLDEWVPLFRRRHVAFIYDCDTSGRTNSAAHAAKVVKVARSVRVVDLDPARADKWDVSDWFNEGRSVEDLRDRINRTPRLPLGEVRA